MKALKIRWANKLMRSKYFVVLTDRQSVIALDGANPATINDIIALQAQSSALQDFHERLGDLIKAHEKAAVKLLQREVKATEKASGHVKSTTTKSRKPKAKKIEVREG